MREPATAQDLSPGRAPAARPPGEGVVRGAGGAGQAGGADEPALLARARNGDAEAFRALVERHQDRAYALALRITRSATEAAEATQEALVRAWVALPGFRGDASFATWLHRVVARRALDRCEALAVRRAREVAEEEAHQQPEEPGREQDPGRSRRLERLLAELTPAQRAAVTLYYLEEQPVEAVAAALGLPRNTVKTHLHRARAALREGWLREEAEP